MRARLCSNIKSDGTPCRAVALAGYSRCFAHQRQLRRQQARRYPAIRLGPLADQHSTLRAIGRILNAIAANSIPLERSSALLQIVLRAIAQHKHDYALTTSARSIDLHPFALPPAQLYNQPNPLDSQLTTCNLPHVTEFESR